MFAVVDFSLLSDAAAGIGFELLGSHVDVDSVVVGITGDDMFSWELESKPRIKGLSVPVTKPNTFTLYLYLN